MHIDSCASTIYLSTYRDCRATEIYHFWLHVLIDEHVGGLEVAMKQRPTVRLLVVEVPHALGDSVREAKTRACPSPCAPWHKHVEERAVLDVLEHDAELVRSLVPHGAEHTHEVRMMQRGHDLRGREREVGWRQEALLDHEKINQELD